MHIQTNHLILSSAWNRDQGAFACVSPGADQLIWNPLTSTLTLAKTVQRQLFVPRAKLGWSCEWHAQMRQWHRYQCAVVTFLRRFRILQVDVPVMQCLNLCVHAHTQQGWELLRILHEGETADRKASTHQETCSGAASCLPGPGDDETLLHRCLRQAARWECHCGPHLSALCARARVCVCVSREEKRGSVCFTSGGNWRVAVKWASPPRRDFSVRHLNSSTLCLSLRLCEAASSPLPPLQAGHAQSVPLREHQLMTCKLWWKKKHSHPKSGQFKNK